MMADSTSARALLHLAISAIDILHWTL